MFSRREEDAPIPGHVCVHSLNQVVSDSYENWPIHALYRHSHIVLTTQRYNVFGKVINKGVGYLAH